MATLTSVAPESIPIASTDSRRGSNSSKGADVPIRSALAVRSASSGPIPDLFPAAAGPQMPSTRGREGRVPIFRIRHWIQ